MSMTEIQSGRLARATALHAAVDTVVNSIVASLVPGQMQYSTLAPHAERTMGVQNVKANNNSTPFLLLSVDQHRDPTQDQVNHHRVLAALETLGVQATTMYGKYNGQQEHSIRMGRGYFTLALAIARRYNQESVITVVDGLGGDVWLSLTSPKDSVRQWIGTWTEIQSTLDVDSWTYNPYSGKTYTAIK